MKGLVALVCLSVLGACDQIAASTEAKACDAYYEGVFATDLDFPLWSAENMDEPISFADFRRKYYPGKLSELEKIRLQIWQESQLAIRTTYTKADKPEFIRGVGLNGFACEFLLVNGDVYDEDSLIDDARSRASSKKLRELADSLGDDELSSTLSKSRTRQDCCIP